MLVKKRWIAYADGNSTSWMQEGYYLFGVIPLFICDLSTRIRGHATRVSS